MTAARIESRRKDVALAYGQVLVADCIPIEPTREVVAIQPIARAGVVELGCADQPLHHQLLVMRHPVRAPGIHLRDRHHGFGVPCERATVLVAKLAVANKGVRCGGVELTARSGDR